MEYRMQNRSSVKVICLSLIPFMVKEVVTEVQATSLVTNASIGTDNYSTYAGQAPAMAYAGLCICVVQIWVFKKYKYETIVSGKLEKLFFNVLQRSREFVNAIQLSLSIVTTEVMLAANFCKQAREFPVK